MTLLRERHFLQQRPVAGVEDADDAIVGDDYNAVAEHAVSHGLHTCGQIKELWMNQDGWRGAVQADDKQRDDRYHAKNHDRGQHGHQAFEKAQIARQGGGIFVGGLSHGPYPYTPDRCRRHAP